MKKGQIVITALWTVLVLVIGLIFVWPYASPMFTSFASNINDPLVTFMLSAIGFGIFVAAIISFFVFMGVASGR